MSTTPNLLISHVAPSQNNKETTLNTSLDDFDGAITGLFTQAMADADQTPSADNCHFNAMFYFTGALTAIRKFIIPLTKKFYLVKNNTTGGFGVNVIGASGTGALISVAMGYVLLYCDGTNVILLSQFGSGDGKVASINLTNQEGAQALQTVYAVPAGQTGIYRVCYQAKVTEIDTVSSSLGGTNGFQVSYTDGVDNTVLTSAPGPTDTSNALTTWLQGEFRIYAAGGTNIQFSFDYTSGFGAPSTAAMAYSLHVRVEKL